MIDYSQYKDNETFMIILECLRENCLFCEDEVREHTEIDGKEVAKYYSLAQAIVVEELARGEIEDVDGYNIAMGYMNYLLDDEQKD